MKTTDKDGCILIPQLRRIADCEDVPIVVGSVIKNIKDGDIGVVKNIYQEGDIGIAGLHAVGDLEIKIGHGSTRTTNMYGEWKHVPREEQSYRMRYWSWLLLPRDTHDETYGATGTTENMCIGGLLDILPKDPLDWDHGDIPYEFSHAMEYLVDHLDSLENELNTVNSELEIWRRGG